MNSFFKSKKGIALIAVCVIMLGFMLQSTSSGSLNSFSSKIIGKVTAPFQGVITEFTGGINSVLDRFQKKEYLIEENKDLKDENAAIKQQIIEFDQYKQENENLKSTLGIKTQNPTYTAVPAKITARDPSELFYAFTLDKGSDDGVAKKNVVITNEGLVGMVTDVQPKYCTVTSMLDPKLSVGATTSASSNTGVLTGDISLLEQKKAKMIYVSRNHTMNIGDTVVTSGNQNTLPKNIIIGKVDSIDLESDGLSMTAIITPSVDAETVKQVQIITGF